MAKAKKQTYNQLDRKEELEKKCPTCGKSSVVRDYHRNIEICENCGRILKEGIKDRGPEWRAFDQEQRDQRSRAGPPSTETIHDRGLSTQIDWKNKDSTGKSLSPERRSQMQRLRKWHKRAKVTSGQDRNLASALSEIDRMASQLGLPKSVREEASRIYRGAVDKDLVRGRSIEGIASASLYLACRKNQFPRTLAEVSEVSRVDKREIGRNYRFISRELDIPLEPIDPVKYVSRFGSDLDVSGEVRTKAIEIIRKAKEAGITSGKKPSATAAAALYTASIMFGERRSQKSVAEVANTSEVTVRDRYKEILDKLDVDIDS